MPRSASALQLQELQLLLQSKPVQAAAEELSHLTRKVHNRKRIMATPGALPAIVSMLSGSDSGAARFAAAALQNLAIEPEHCPELIAAGCMQPLLQLLQQTSDDQDALLAAAAGALANLACEEVGTNSTIAAAPGCVSRLVQLLSHSSCVVREAAASVLAKLAWEPELCKPIADAGALKPLVSLLSTDLSDDGGRQVAAACIENLTYDSAPIRKSVVDAGGVPLLVSLLESNCEAAQKSAAGALHNLALARANCVKIAAAGGIEPLVGLLETGPEAVQAVAGGAIGKLALDPANRVEIVECRDNLLLSQVSTDSSNSTSSQ